jgi:competence protein ComEA
MDFFKFTRQERNGLILFIMLVLLIYYVPFLWIKVLPPTFSHNVEDFLDTNSVITQVKNQSSSYENQDPNHFRQVFSFNPNTISFDSLLLLGFDRKAAATLVKYRQKGGTINSLEKLKTIYNMDTALVNSLQSVIQFNTSNIPNQTAQNNIPENNTTLEGTPKKTKWTPKSIEINTADSLSWDQLPKMGAARINRVLKYRRLLGGFYNPDQLLQDNILHDSIYTQIQPFLSCDHNAIIKLDLNSDYKTLSKHPYMDKKTVYAILKYKEQHGDYTSPDQIKKIISIPRPLGEKLLYYLTVK